MSMQDRVTIDSSYFSLQDFEEALDKMWEEIRQGGTLAQEATEAGLDVSGTTTCSRAEVLTVRKGSAGIDGQTIEIIVAIAAPLVLEPIGRGVYDLWTGVLWPKLKKRFAPSGDEEK